MTVLQGTKWLEENIPLQRPQSSLGNGAERRTMKPRIFISNNNTEAAKVRTIRKKEEKQTTIQRS